MTPERIRIKVAEAMGWTGPFVEREWLREYGPEGEDVWGKCVGTNPQWERDQVPNYPFDLNACAEFEKTLYPDRAEHYYNTLRAVITNNEYHGVMEGYNGWFMLHATALQRCEAYLRVKGLWEETP